MKFKTKDFGMRELRLKDGDSTLVVNIDPSARKHEVGHYIHVFDGHNSADFYVYRGELRKFANEILKELDR